MWANELRTARGVPVEAPAKQAKPKIDPEVRAKATASVREVLLAYAFGWAENMVQAALKAVPLGQNAGQRILARLTREIPDAVEAALARPAGEQQAFAPMLAILSARHETQYSRLFRS